MNKPLIKTYCLGNGASECDGCKQEENWKLINQLDTWLFDAMRKEAKRIDDTECILSGRKWKTKDSVECNHDWVVTQQGFTYMDMRCSKCDEYKRESWD